MKLKNIVKIRRFFRRFNIWLYLICLLLAIAVWCTAMYMNESEGVLNGDQEPAVTCAANAGEA